MRPLQVSIDLRARTTAILRLVGETSHQAVGHNIVEFCFMGFLAGALAVLGSEAVVAAVFVFFLEQKLHPTLLLLGSVPSV